MVAEKHEIGGLKVRLTKRSVDGTPLPEVGECRVWDDAIAGFCLRVYATGRKVYACKYRVGGKQRWFTIGVHGQPWTADKARVQAMEILRDATHGEDAVQAKKERQSALTLAQLIDRYLADGPATRPNKRASSWAADRGSLKHHILPLLGQKRVVELTKSDIARAVHAVAEGRTAKSPIKGKTTGQTHVRGGAGISTRVLAATRAMLGWAIQNDLAAFNPASGISLPKRASVERFLSEAEATRLGGTIAELEETNQINPGHGDAMRLLLLTGARKTEITDLKWSEVDLDRRRINLPPERTKVGGKTGQRRIPLSEPAIDILGRRKSSASEFVFPAPRREGPLAGLQGAWELTRKRAGLPGLRLHDLRHSFASFAVTDGWSLFLVGKVLGHSDTRTTERYAHLTDDPLLELANSVGRFLPPNGRARADPDAEVAEVSSPSASI